MRRAFIALAGLITWCALILQLWLLITTVAPEKGLSTAAAIGWFFSFMTILTNCWVACAFTLPLVMPRSGIGRWLSRPDVQAALLVYILAVGIVYHLLLSDVWDPHGLLKLADTLLHTVVPLLYLLYWIMVVPKMRLPFRIVPSWLLYPVVYVAYALCYGTITGRYPYPFLELPTVGWSSTLLTCSVILAGYALLSFCVVALGNQLVQRSAA